MSELDEVALDWLKNSDNPDTKALRAHVMEMLNVLEARNKRLRGLWRFENAERPEDYVFERLEQAAAFLHIMDGEIHHALGWFIEKLVKDAREALKEK